MAEGSLAYRPYTSPKKRRPDSIAPLAGTEPAPPSSAVSFVRPSAVAHPVLADTHTRSQSVQAAHFSPAHDPPAAPVASTSKSSAPNSRPASPTYTPRSTASSPGPTSPRAVRAIPGRAPYLPGFQPAGVTRSRTDELCSERVQRGEARRMEGVRISRRLAKLVELHFPNPQSETASISPQRSTLSRASSVRSSLAAEIDSLRTKSASEVWGSLVRGVKGAKAEDTRAAEQAIVKWQDDETAKRCAICSAPFSFHTRKHHCRLCGRVVCFLPPTPPPAPPAPGTPAIPMPLRPERCSTFIRYEYDSPVKEARSEKMVSAETMGRVVEVETRDTDPPPSTEGVRVCRECLATVLRRQAVTHPPRVPNYIKLHEILIQLQDEIEAALPELQEMILILSRPKPSAADQKAALAARKKTLACLASYDSLAKRIRDLPDTPAGSSRERLQGAIAARAQLFLAEKLALLKGLGFDDLEAPPRVTVAKGKAPDIKNGNRTAQQKKEVEERAAQLAVLLEQEQLVQTYWEDANAKRQLEDAASLKTSLDELRREIRSIREMA